MLVARAENYLHGRPDLDDTIRRLQAFEKAGAGGAVCAGTDAAGGHSDGLLGGDEAGECADGAEGRAAADGERNLANWACGGSASDRGSAGRRLTAFLHAAREVIDDGTFGFADETLYISELTAMFE